MSNLILVHFTESEIKWKLVVIKKKKNKPFHNHKALKRYDVITYMLIPIRPVNLFRFKAWVLIFLIHDFFCSLQVRKSTFEFLFLASRSSWGEDELLRSAGLRKMQEWGWLTLNAYLPTLRRTFSVWRMFISCFIFIVVIVSPLLCA